MAEIDLDGQENASADITERSVQSDCECGC
jgi:hypothetical protein